MVFIQGQRIVDQLQGSARQVAVFLHGEAFSEAGYRVEVLIIECDGFFQRLRCLVESGHGQVGAAKQTPALDIVRCVEKASFELRQQLFKVWRLLYRRVVATSCCLSRTQSSGSARVVDRFRCSQRQIQCAGTER